MAVHAGILEDLRFDGTIVASGVALVGSSRLKELIRKSLSSDLEFLIEPVTRGDPESPLSWTSKFIGLSVGPPDDES